MAVSSLAAALLFASMCPELVVDAAPELAARLRATFAHREDIDTCARVAIVERDDDALVEVTLPDGRRASRSVVRLGDLEPTIEALLLVPPGTTTARAADPRPAPELVVAPAPAPFASEASTPPTSAPSRQSASRVRVELSLLSSARAASDALGVGAGMLSFVQVDEWLAGAIGRADYLQTMTNGNPPTATASLGFLGGRRFRATSLAVDVYGGPLLAYQGASAEVTETPEKGHIVREHSAGVLVRGTLGTRLVFRPEALLTSFLGLDLDVGERGEAENGFDAVPRLPLWTLGLSVGVTVGTR